MKMIEAEVLSIIAEVAIITFLEDFSFVFIKTISQDSIVTQKKKLRNLVLELTTI